MYKYQINVYFESYFFAFIMHDASLSKKCRVDIIFP